MKNGFKRHLTKALAFALSAITVCSVGCGRIISEYDKNKTQIFVYYVDGDVKREWLKQAASDFNATDEEYQVVPLSTASEEYETMLSSNGGQAHAYLTSGGSYQDLIEKGVIADLSSILDVNVDGITIADKFENLDEYKAYYSIGTKKGLYAIPLGISPMHLVFDFDLFNENGWLIYQKDENGRVKRDENGKPMLSVGHDGKAGTYDDGQPVDLTEWQEMMDAISRTDNTKAFIYTTKYEHYVESVLVSLIAQFGGIEAYRTFCNGYGDYYDENGDLVNVPFGKNSYEVYNMPALEQAMQFFADWMIKNEKYVHKDSWDTTETSHRDAQQKFVTGYKTGVQQAAFLVEGSYWEIGLKSYFDLLEQRGDSDRGYGKRDFRYMLLPSFNDYSDVSYMSCNDIGAMIVSNDKDKKIVEKTKEFVAFTLKDKYLQQFTVDSGSKRPFKYSLTNGYSSQLTPFQKTTFEMLSDTENVKVLTVTDYIKTDPTRLGLVKFNTTGYTFSSNMSDGNYARALSILRRFTAHDFAEGLFKFKKAQWNSATFNI